MTHQDSSALSSRLTPDDAAEAVARRPHEGAGPCIPFGGRRPGRAKRAAGAASLALTLLVAAFVSAALLAACGGSSGGSAIASASPSPSPVPSPLITSGEPPAAAVDAVRRFWTLVGEGEVAEAKATAVAPGSPLLEGDEDSIASARFVRVLPSSVSRAPADGATIEFSVIVWIEPSSQPSPWGEPGEHQLFEHVVRMSDGSWRMWDSGTGP